MRLPAILLVLALPSCLTALGTQAADLKSALESITAAELAARTMHIASDKYEGRGPGDPTEPALLQHLVDSFQSMGLQPGNPDGTWYQDVPLVGIRSAVEARIARGGTNETWQFPQDYVAWSPWVRERVDVAPSELVFVGYGVVAPEFGWDDYKDVDVRGKTLVMLVNDPALPDPAAPSRLDPAQFRGSAMTYYGRWTYKFEIAARKGAAAALVVHETGPAGYPYFVVINSWGRENFDLQTPDANTNKVPVCGWVSLERMQRLARESGFEFPELKKRALSRDFKPLSLGATFSATASNTLRRVQSRNVVAKLDGAHAERRSEYVVYTAHWDHLGKDSRLEGDQIFNGALDNASGTAALLEIAEAFTKLEQRPDRTLLFLAVTAEEQGLLGAKYYAEHPLYPLASTLANLNIDGVNVAGRQKDIGVVGHGQNTLEDLLAVAARTQQRSVRPEAEPEKGGYYRSDHFEFAKVGVPALFVDSISDDVLGRPPGYGRMRRDEYLDEDYHKVSDEMKSWWDLSGAVEDARLLVRVGYDVAQTESWPEWKAGSEFKARREASLKQARAARSETPPGK